MYTVRVEEPAALQARFGDVAAVAHESFDGALVVKTLGLAEHEAARLASAAADLRRDRLRVGLLRASFEPAFDLLPNLGVIALIGVGSWRVSTGAVSTGQLVEAMALFAVLSLPMRILGYLLEEMPRAVVSVERIRAVLATPPQPGPDQGTVEALPDGPLSISSEHLSFGYGSGEEVIRGVSCTIAPGEVVAMVGSTGSGKSTLCHLLAGLIEPDRGTVRLGGVPVDRTGRPELRAAVAMVFQETFLFADAVSENLALGLTVSPAELRWATGVARAEDFIDALPEGIDRDRRTGVTLSGAVAPATARPGPVASSSGADPRRRHRRGRSEDRAADPDPPSGELVMTTVIVAHRVSTIALADRILFLEGGRLVATGPHLDLLAHEPRYRALVRAYEVAEAEVHP
ncbi:MAG: ABC transporter ATP-binding protein [Acidimicrobiales bacterium]